MTKLARVLLGSVRTGVHGALGVLSVRRASAAVLAGALVAVAAAPAVADVPEGWSKPEPVDPVHAVLLLGGIPLLIIIVVSLLIFGPSFVRGERERRAGHVPEAQWFGGPRSGTAALPAPDDEESKAGGASGRW